MYLQSLELFGFKSFATKTTFTFPPGVTAIVGPNGCGKSNVLDAIRWVLGEQSAKALRGGEMADVIFSGTDSRKAVGVAEVSMNFTECEKELGVDWNEVRVTRRVFRDGNSEYLLNKTPCRLRDIHQLFMDTGIGRSAYSIMEQGKIDLILSSRPEDRRAIFEEAAGITKYKAQKREALRKLEATDANLLRLSDVIKEVKRQIGSLQRQAAKARRYQSIHSDLRTLETHLARHEYDALEVSRLAAHGAIERLLGVQGNLEQDIETRDGALTSHRRDLAETEQNFQIARQDVQDLKNHISNAENRINSNGERLHEFRGLVERYQADIASAEERLQRQESEIHDTDRVLEEIAGNLAFQQKRLDEKRSATNALSGQRVEAERSLQAQFGSITKIEQRLASLRGEISRIQAFREGSEVRIGILADEFDKLTSAATMLEDQVRVTNAQLAQTQHTLGTSQQVVQDAESTVRAAMAELAAVDQHLAQEERRRADKESKLEVLRQLNEQGEGFSEGTQAVLRGLDHPQFFKPALRGSLASHLRVEPRFIPAVEAALGLHLQAVLLADTMVAESIIKTLTGKKLGRASLVLRDFLPAIPPPANGVLPEGAVAWAGDCVEASGEVQPLVAQLLARTAIVKDAATAISLKGSWAELTFVTMAGETLSPEGILQGGEASEINTSVLQRKAQILELESEASVLLGEIIKRRSQREEIAARLGQTEAREQEAREQTQRIHGALSNLRAELALHERELRDTRNKAQNLQREKEGADARLAEATASVNALDEESGLALSTLNELQHGQATLQSELERLRAKEQELTGELNDLRIRVATEQQRHDSLRNQRQPMTARLLELRELISQRRAEIEHYQAKGVALDEETQRISSEIAGARDRTILGDAAVQQLAAKRDATAGTIEAADAELRILRRQIGDIHEQRSHQEVKQTQIALRLENLREQIVRRYQIDLSDFQADYYRFHCALRDQQKRLNRGSTGVEAAEATGDSSTSVESEDTAIAPEATAGESDQERQIDWTRVEMLVRDLEQRIDTLGPINVDAIQEFEELEQRHTFLENQNADLTKSKMDLLDVISRINSTTRKLFAETFERIRINFQEMFVELFGGGKANLVLVDEADVLESGIDIIAKPPGKQLQSVSLLSGGERTMTAVALLFSIYMVKPSPFCVLDEMDAPLDESNINRFIKILDRFVTQSQFVVITHNKRTIARADVLYGVTMEEQGVSKLVGVKFLRRADPLRDDVEEGTQLMAPASSLSARFGKTDELVEARLGVG